MKKARTAEVREVRRESLATRLASTASDDAFQRAVAEDDPLVDDCRVILRKPTGRRTMDDIHVLKALFSSSKLLEFFADLDAFKLDRLYQALEICTFNEKGVYVFKQNEPGDSFYLVLTGHVHIVRTEQPVTADAVAITTTNVHLFSGESFGERALLSDTDMRAASAIIGSDFAELVFINRIVFADLMRESQSGASTGNSLEISKRFRSNKDIIRNIFLRNSSQRSEKDLKFAVEYLKSVKFFSRFSFEVRKQLCKAMRLISAVTNTVLFEEGQIGKHFYIIFTGCVEVSVRAKNRFEETSENVVSRLAEGDYFGELALSEENGIRRATVVCADYCELLVLGRDQYGPLIKKYQNEYHAQYAHLLRQNPYFIGPEWDDNTIEGMCSVMTEKYIPFKGEICKQGSRATEMFLVTRGECVMIHEGKHPITSQAQLYELGRYGPNSVLGCTEASAGKFNDIYLRDYSIYAESPVKILVLSRFDIFHLMSAEARASLQRSSHGYIRESIESRALKTIAWERYRKDFLADFMSSRHSNAIGSDRGPCKMVKSNSAPVLPPSQQLIKPLIEPGGIILTNRRNHLGCLVGDPADQKVDIHEKPSSVPKPVRDQTILEEEADSDDDFQRRHSDVSTPILTAAKAINSVVPDTSNQEEVAARRHSTMAFSSRSKSTRSNFSASNNKLRESNAHGGHTAEASLGEQVQGKQMTKSRSTAALQGATSDSSPTLPRILREKPLYGATTSPGDRRRSTTIRTNSNLSVLPAKMAITSSVNSATAIWNPVHGVCQPFALLGFMRENTRPKTSLSVSKTRNARTADARKGANTNETEAADASELIVTHFRVFGKVRDLNEAMGLFRHICTLERLQPPGKDTGCFAIYKEDEMTMALQNFFTEAHESSDAEPVDVYQFRGRDLPHANGQRYACVSVLLSEPSAKVIESVAVYVYQCFPTPQSAMRFARQITSATLSTSTLYIVPLFDWVPLIDLERFDTRHADLEQALEGIMDSSSQTYKSTWKARKDALKKARSLVKRHEK